jgi:hypothetical protein
VEQSAGINLPAFRKPNVVRHPSDRDDHEHKPTLRKIKRGVANAPINQKTPLLILPDTPKTTLTTIKVLTTLTSKIIKFRNI